MSLSGPDRKELFLVETIQRLTSECVNGVVTNIHINTINACLYLLQNHQAKRGEMTPPVTHTSSLESQYLPIPLPPPLPPQSMAVDSTTQPRVSRSSPKSPSSNTERSGVLYHAELMEKISVIGRALKELEIDPSDGKLFASTQFKRDILVAFLEREQRMKPMRLASQQNKEFRDNIANARLTIKTKNQVNLLTLN